MIVDNNLVLNYQPLTINFQLPKIYPITDFRLSGLSHAEQVEKLISGGAKFIQLREKNLSPRDFFEQAKSVLEIARKTDVKIIINDRVDIALALKADGVHLGQDDFPIEEAREILGKTAIIGFSTHNILQAINAIKLPLDYIAIGPVFSTKTKENRDEIVGLNGLNQIRKAIGDFPLVAIGGINIGNIQSVFENGADSCAIVSDIISDPENISSKMRSFSHI